METVSSGQRLGLQHIIQLVLNLILQFDVKEIKEMDRFDFEMWF